MKKDRLHFLLLKKVQDNISVGEDKELNDLLLSHWMLESDHNIDWEGVYAKRIRPKKSWKLSIYKWSAVAAVMLMIGVSFLWRHKEEQKIGDIDRHTAMVLDQIGGATDGAVLSIDSSRVFELAGKRFGEVIQLIENPKVSNMTPRMFTVTTPKANKYSLILPDGSKVWLNANSEITFPEFFDGDARQVTTKGEVYLEVTKSKRPFIITTNGIETKVLGTSLNINSYQDKKTNTTLFTGKIAISNGDDTQVLLPGQAILATHNSLRKYTPNLEKTLSWKNNKFYFENDNILDILEELGRWYGVEFDFADDLSRTKLYNGVIDRNLSLQQTLEILNFSTSYKLTISNNHIIHVQQIQ